MNALALRVASLMTLVSFPGYTFEVSEGHGGTYLQGTYYDRDAVDPTKWEKQYTRKWLLSPHMTDSELVQTAFKLVLTSHEHQVREKFKYRGERILSPHYNIEDLVALCRRGRSDAGGRPA